MASDPEGASYIGWTLAIGNVDINGNGDFVDPGELVASANDEGDFNISQNGVLTFKSSPDYEMSTGGGPEGILNDYEVVVQASDGSKVGYFKVTVSVTDEEEPGEVTVTPSRLQYRPNAVLMVVTPTDPDGIVGTSVLQWYRSSSKSATGTPIANEDPTTYTITDDDVGRYVRVVATYTDGSSVRDQTASFVTENPVQAARSDANRAPEFASTDVNRRIAENSAGTIVGGPVTATDADGDILTYSLSGAGATQTVGGVDVARFTINPATGQLMVGDSAVVSFEDSGTAHTYEVMVAATDSSGIAADAEAMVTITVTDLNEKPIFTEETPGAGFATARPEPFDGDGAALTGEPLTTALTIGTYTATDPEQGSVTLSLVGGRRGLVRAQRRRT